MRGAKGRDLFWVEYLLVLAVAGVWAKAKARSKAVSGTPRVMAGMARTKKAERIVNWSEKPVEPWEATPPKRGEPQVVEIAIME